VPPENAVDNAEPALSKERLRNVTLRAISEIMPDHMLEHFSDGIRRSMSFSVTSVRWIYWRISTLTAL
jgi:hypothetical protein